MPSKKALSAEVRRLFHLGLYLLRAQVAETAYMRVVQALGGQPRVSGF